MAEKRILSQLDPNQHDTLSYDVETQSRRVSVVGVDGLGEAIAGALKDKKLEIVSAPAIEYRTIEVERPIIIKEIEYRTIEIPANPIIVVETQIKVVEVEKERIVERLVNGPIEYKTLEIPIPVIVKEPMDLSYFQQTMLVAQTLALIFIAFSLIFHK